MNCHEMFKFIRKMRVLKKEFKENDHRCTCHGMGKQIDGCGCGALQGVKTFKNSVADLVLLTELD